VFILSCQAFQTLVDAEIGLLAKAIIHEEPFPLPHTVELATFQVPIQQPQQITLRSVNFQHVMHIHVAHIRHKSYCICFTLNFSIIHTDVCAVEVTLSKSLIPQ